MRKILIAFAAFVVLALGYVVYTNMFWGKVIQVSDVAKEQHLTLTSSKKYVDSARIHVSGRIDGTAMLANKTIGPGEVEMDIYTGDYYQTNFEIEYRPESVRSGNLRIQYALYGTN